MTSCQGIQKVYKKNMYTLCTPGCTSLYPLSFNTKYVHPLYAQKGRECVSHFFFANRNFNLSTYALHLKGIDNECVCSYRSIILTHSFFGFDFWLAFFRFDNPRFTMEIYSVFRKQVYDLI
jgi:hypothetical protein